jgi:dipeptidyl aminopeptidase/acylaminoacyl peptidase
VRAKYVNAVAAVLAAFLLPAVAMAADPTPVSAESGTKPRRIPASVFASQPLLTETGLSPDGSVVVARIVRDGQPNIVGIEPGTRAVKWVLPIPADRELRWFRWAGNSRVLFSTSSLQRIHGEEFRLTRLFVFDIPSRKLSYVGRKQVGLLGDDVLFVDPAGQYVLTAVQRDIYEWPSVWRFPLDGTAMTSASLVQEARPGVWDWYADDVGVVRLGLERSSRSLRVWYRREAQGKLTSIAKIKEDDLEEKLWDVARVVSGSDDGYIVSPGPDGRAALRHFNYATRAVGEVIYANPEWDVTDVDIDENNRPIAAYYTDETDRVAWLDPKMQVTQRRLEEALPEQQVWVTSRSQDDKRMLVYAGGADDPGALYLYDASQRKLDVFSEIRSGLSAQELALPRAVAYPARDGTQIRAYLTLPRGREAKGLPLIILPHGGPYGVRDKLDYSDEVQFLANRGYAVLQPNYRGSAGYGTKFAELGEGQIGRTMQDDLDDGMDWLVSQGTVDRARVCVAGASYGGYAALWAVIRNPERYRCGASFAGVTDWKRQLSYQSGSLSRKEKREWRATVTGSDKFNLDEVSPAKQVARLTRPVLLAHGDKDTRVPFSQFNAMRDAAQRAGKPIDTLVFEGEGHGFDKPANEEKWYTALETFLQKHNPAE